MVIQPGLGVELIRAIAVSSFKLPHQNATSTDKNSADYDSSRTPQASKEAFEFTKSDRISNC
ncbi:MULTISPECIES: hypothetical protein [unclassified Tolypothrix]|uniref:hypothetical protein n=1 Tax=unclassified Tolypothrix TaxID=2649714 RepID=UPI0005EAB462|nr:MULTISPECIES: hypothetical protein [unclassified Tolypothrix]EKF01410.1 hypothetical protein FDUTEX481_08059 [Tolypothrix sp. PCC 7601]MBE9083569.1 hypothetical protein [Tolypothrix sp. LEGE 11397]UYD24370.1 hypothetical protein HGR01_23300 [Tolypothrix sp. PCC 7712]UYD33395.1 hypothetical protein HG267_31370 [Tolypothrix sp. PCC 7601]